MTNQPLLTTFAAANSIRQLAAKYSNSLDPHTNKQHKMLMDMADDIIQGLIDNAKFRYENLHINIRSQLSFEVLDILGMAEKHVEDHQQ